MNKNQYPIKIYFDLFYIKNISRLATLSCNEFYEVFMFRTSLGIGSKIVRPNLNSHFSTTIFKKGYESLEKTPLEVLRKKACYEIAKGVFLPEYWKIYKEALPSEPCKLEDRFDVIVNSLGEKLEKFFESQESKSADDSLKSNGYRNLLSRPQVIAYPNMALPISITSKQPFRGRLEYNISNPEDVKKVQESYFANFSFGFPLSEISQKIELEKMAREDAIKDSKPTNSLASNSALKLQPTEKQVTPNT